MKDIKGSLEDFSKLSPAERFKKLNISLILTNALAFVAAIGAVTLWKQAAEQIDTKKELELKVEELRQENIRLQKQLKTDDGNVRWENEPESQVISSNPQPTPIAIVTTNSLYLPLLANQNTPGGSINVVPIIWLALIALTLVYLIALLAVFLAKNANTIDFAKDLIKMLTGFFIGIVTGILGLST